MGASGQGRKRGGMGARGGRREEREGGKARGMEWDYRKGAELEAGKPARVVRRLTRSLEHGVHQRRLAVVDVGDDGDVPKTRRLLLRHRRLQVHRAGETSGGRRTLESFADPQEGQDQRRDAPRHVLLVQLLRPRTKPGTCSTGDTHSERTKEGIHTSQSFIFFFLVYK